MKEKENGRPWKLPSAGAVVILTSTRGKVVRNGTGRRVNSCLYIYIYIFVGVIKSGGNFKLLWEAGSS